MTSPLVRPRPISGLLRSKAAAVGCSPEEYLVAIIKATATDDEAAAIVGVSRRTICRWRERFGITVTWR